MLRSSPWTTSEHANPYWTSKSSKYNYLIQNWILMDKRGPRNGGESGTRTPDLRIMITNRLRKSSVFCQPNQLFTKNIVSKYKSVYKSHNPQIHTRIDFQPSQNLSKHPTYDFYTFDQPRCASSPLAFRLNNPARNTP